MMRWMINFVTYFAGLAALIVLIASYAWTALPASSNTALATVMLAPLATWALTISYTFVFDLSWAAASVALPKVVPSLTQLWFRMAGYSWTHSFWGRKLVIPFSTRKSYEAFWI